MFVIQKKAHNAEWVNANFWCNELECVVMCAYPELADAMIRATSMLMREGGQWRVVEGEFVRQWVYDVA